MSITAYLAGPDVFLPDAEAHAARKVAICAGFGITGRPPLNEDVESLKSLPEDRLWRVIFDKDVAMMEECDIIIANLTPFRGPSADAGTVYELGFMRALGRPVFGYSHVARRFGARTLAALGPAARWRPDGAWEDEEGMAVEEFDLHDNLMLEGGIHASGGSFEVEEVPAERRWRDLTAFTRCVAAAARGLRAAR
jgi:nucleoside 2-deoxyribosyltransferase